MVPLALTFTSLLLVGTLVLAALIGSAVAYFYVRARRHEAAETEREEREISERAAELVRIRERIEEIYERQQTGSETQFARVNQELKDLQMNLDAKGRQIEGVQGQVRYELKRHEEEIAELRTQLREAVAVFAAAALPAARPAAPALPAHEPKPEPPAKAAAIYAPSAPEPEPTPPAFAPLDDMLKDDHELLDDLFGGTTLDSATSDADAQAESASPDEPEALPEKVATPFQNIDRSPIERPARPERPYTAHSVVDFTDTSKAQDDFEFVELDPAEVAAAPEPTPSTPEPFGAASIQEGPGDPTPPEVEEAPVQPEPAAEVPSDTPTDLPSALPHDPFAEAAASAAPPPMQWADLNATLPEPEATEPEVPLGQAEADAAETLPTPAADVDETRAAHDETGGASEVVNSASGSTPHAGLDAETGSLPVHSGDGMRAPDYADPFAEASSATPTPSFDDAPAPSLAEEAYTEDPLAFDAAELAPSVEEAPAAPSSQKAADDLTVLSAVDAEVQDALYGLGITTIEEIARWNRTDARRVAGQLKTLSEEDIMERWVFEAQSVLFDRYQNELRAQRQQRLNAN